ncbi:MAG: cytochrome c nitrite reductase small subunit [Myxococcota bacterium]|jgi:cytochrome c nitrite reductase small subunit|nr:cytochrome c nitrite reductase small subunit [Myxococcota bacterium]
MTLPTHNLLGRWSIPVFLSLGVLLGSFVLVARASNAVSYFSNQATTCLNCHVMTNAYATWRHGSHARVASCNDCHVPHGNPVATYAFKAMDGGRHSYVFTLRNEPEVLRLSEGAVPVVEDNCVRCHADQWLMIRLADSEERTCWSCHHNIHGDVRSLSATPNARRPTLPSAGLFDNPDRMEDPSP